MRWSCHANGTKYRKSDPHGPTFSIEAIDAALAYDFPGLINTSGGDLGGADTDNSGTNGGNVVFKYGYRVEDMPADYSPSF